MSLGATTPIVFKLKRVGPAVKATFATSSAKGRRPLWTPGSLERVFMGKTPWMPILAVFCGTPQALARKIGLTASSVGNIDLTPAGKPVSMVTRPTAVHHRTGRPAGCLCGKCAPVHTNLHSPLIFKHDLSVLQRHLPNHLRACASITFAGFPLCKGLRCCWLFSKHLFQKCRGLGSRIGSNFGLFLTDFHKKTVD